MVPCWQAVWRIIFKICVIFGVRFETQKVDKKGNLRKNWKCKLYSRVFWLFLPNVIKIDPYNFEVYRFKVGAFFETQCITLTSIPDGILCVNAGPSFATVVTRSWSRSWVQYQAEHSARNPTSPKTRSYTTSWNAFVIKNPTSPETRSYLTLWNVFVIKIPTSPEKRNCLTLWNMFLVKIPASPEARSYHTLWNVCR